MEEQIRKVLIRRRQNNVDIYAVAHSLMDIPAQFWVFSTHLILFKTTHSRVSQAREFKHIQEHIKEVNSHPNPRRMNFTPFVLLYYRHSYSRGSLQRQACRFIDSSYSCIGLNSSR